MRKTIAIITLIIFLLNAVGLYGVIVGFQLKAAAQANQALDEDKYTNSEAITIKVPITIPYSVDEQDYHRVTGEFEYKGEVYRLVKQKLYRDTLQIICVKDNKSKKINQALADYVKTFTDRPFNAKQQGAKLTAYSIIKDFLNTWISIEQDSNGWNECVSLNELAVQYFSFYSSKIKYPPKSFSLS